MDPRLLLDRTEGEDVRADDDRDGETLDRDDETLDRLRVGATEGVEGRLGAVTFGADDRLVERPRICVGTWTDRVGAEREELWLGVGLTDRVDVRLGVRVTLRVGGATCTTCGLSLDGLTRITRDPEDDGDERDGVRWVGVEGRTLRVGVRLGAGLLGIFGGELERRRVGDEETLRGGGDMVRVGAEREELWLGVGLTDRVDVRLGVRVTLRVGGATCTTCGLSLDGLTRITRDPEDDGDERDGVRWVGVEGRTLRVGVRLGAGLLGIFGGELERRRVGDEETLRGGGDMVRVGVLVVGATLAVGAGELGVEVRTDAEVFRVVRDTSALRERVGAVGVLDVALVVGDVRTARPLTLRSPGADATARRFLSAGTSAAASRSIRTLRTVALREEAAAAVRTLRERAPEANLTRPWPFSRVTARARARAFVAPWTSGPRIARRGE